MAWRLARGLEKLRSQVNEKYPKRSKASDGSVGDTSHSARKSDHNPDSRGIVHAIDITHDPRNGFDSYKFADHLLATQDPRISYIISNRRIGSGPSGPSPGVWRKYTGANPHDHHVHISIITSREDDISAWNIGDAPATPQPEAPIAPSVLRLAMKGPKVTNLKAMLKAKGIPVSDGDLFDNQTKLGVQVVQLRNGLDDDGVVGPQTWKKLA